MQTDRKIFLLKIRANAKPVQVADNEPVTFSTLRENNRVLCHIRASRPPGFVYRRQASERDINGVVADRQKSRRRSVVNGTTRCKQ